MAFRIDFDFYGETQVSRTLLRTAERVGDPEPVFLNLGEYFRRIAKRQFDTQGRQSGHPWKQLAWSTFKRKGHDAILVLTKRLMNSLTRKEDPEHLEVITDESMWWGSLVPYGKFHQHGGEKDGKPHPPQRKLIDLTERQKRETVKRIQRFIMTGEVRP